MLLYPSCMFRFKFQLIILVPALLILGFLVGSDWAIKEHHSVAPKVPVGENPSPCEELQITSTGAICKSRYGFVVRLDFPKVDLRRALAGEEYLPHARTELTVHEKTFGNKVYRNIVFVLRWESNTPEFLQIYLDEYLPYWGNRVPYRLFWSARYEVCSIENCTEWVTINEAGEFLPSDVNDLQDDLAADANFNGAPAAFWNTNVSP